MIRFELRFRLRLHSASEIFVFVSQRADALEDVTVISRPPEISLGGGRTLAR